MKSLKRRKVLHLNVSIRAKRFSRLKSFFAVSLLGPRIRNSFLMRSYSPLRKLQTLRMTGYLQGGRMTSLRLSNTLIGYRTNVCHGLGGSVRRITDKSSVCSPGGRIDSKTYQELILETEIQRAEVKICSITATGPFSKILPQLMSLVSEVTDEKYRFY